MDDRVKQILDENAGILQEILDAYAADLQGELEKEPPAPGMWIFRRGVDHETPLRAVLALLEKTRAEGRREGAKAIAEQMDYQCACRCLKHRKSACPHCLDVYGCPVHSEVDPSVLRPEFLKDPKKVARALYLELAFHERWPLDGFADEEKKAAWVEAVRKIVTVRMEARRG